MHVMCRHAIKNSLKLTARTNTKTRRLAKNHTHLMKKDVIINVKILATYLDIEVHNSSNLAKHKRTRDENKGHMCSYENCGYTSTARQELDFRYQSAHTNICNFVYDHCRFINNQGKKKHIEMHEHQASFIMQDDGTQLYDVDDSV